MNDKIEAMKLWEEAKEDIKEEAMLGQQLLKDINKDAAAIKAIQARIAARGMPQIIRKIFQDQSSKTRCDPGLMDHDSDLPTQLEPEKLAKADIIWSGPGPGGRPGKTIYIRADKVDTKVTASIFIEDKNEPLGPFGRIKSDDDSTQGQIAIIQKPRSQFYQFLIPSEPGIQKWYHGAMSISARKHLKHMSDSIEKVRLVPWVKSEEFNNGPPATISIAIEHYSEEVHTKAPGTATEDNTLEPGYLKMTERRLVVWPIQFKTRLEMEEAINDPKERFKEEYAEVLENHTLPYHVVNRTDVIKTTTGPERTIRISIQKGKVTANIVHNKEEPGSAKTKEEHKKTQNKVLDEIYRSALANPYVDSEDEPDKQLEPEDRKTQFRNLVKHIKTKQRIRNEETRFYCPKKGCMWEKEEEEKDSDEDDCWDQERAEASPYKWPCPNCELYMEGPSRTTQYVPFGYRYLKESDINEIKKGNTTSPRRTKKPVL